MLLAGFTSILFGHVVRQSTLVQLSRLAERFSKRYSGQNLVDI